MSAPSSPTVVTNVGFNGLMGNPGTPSWRLFNSYGAYGGGLNTASWTIDNSSVTNEWHLYGITVNADLPVIRAKQLFTLGECDALDLLNSLSTD
jgi:hypothetical protein